MTGEEVAKAMESLAGAIRLRPSVSPREAVEALALVLGVRTEYEPAPPPPSSPARQPEPRSPSLRSEAARAAGRASAAVRKAIFGSAQPRTQPERSSERSFAPPNEVTERTPNEVSSVRGGLGGSVSGSEESEEQKSPAESEGSQEQSGSSHQVNESATRPNEVRTLFGETPNEVTERSLQVPNEVRTVFEAWQAETDSRRSKLDRKRVNRIRARLKEGFTPDDLIAAIRNRRNDPFLMGHNDTGRVYDGLQTLLRDAAQVERLMKLTTPQRPRSANGHRGPLQPSHGMTGLEGAKEIR